MPNNKKPGNSNNKTNTGKPKGSKKEIAAQAFAALAGVALAAQQTNDPNSLSSRTVQALDNITGNNLNKPAELLNYLTREGFPDMSDYRYLLSSDTNPTEESTQAIEEFTQARLRTANVIQDFNSTVENIVENINIRNLSDEEKVKTLAPLIQEMQSAAINELKCLIHLLAVLDASGTQEEQAYYKNSKDFFLALFDNIPTGATVNFRQFSVYGTTAQPGWTTDLSAIKNGIINLNYQGGATLAHTGFNTVVKDIQDAKITPTASKPLVIILRTDGKIQDEAQFAQNIADIRAATNGHVKFIVTYVEGVNEPVYGSIDTQTISKYLLPSDLVFSFYEPGAVVKALEAMTEIVQAACGAPPTTTGSPTGATPGTPTPSSAPSVSPTGPGLDSELAALTCISILLCIPLFRPRVKFGPRKDGEREEKAAPLAGSRAARFDVEAGGSAGVFEDPMKLHKATHTTGWNFEPSGGTSSTGGNRTWNTQRTQQPDLGASDYEPAFNPTPAEGETWKDVWDRMSFQLRASWAPIILAGLVTEGVYQAAKKAGVANTDFDESRLGKVSKYVEPDLIKLFKMMVACCTSEKNDKPTEEQRSNSEATLVIAGNPILESLREAAASLNRSDSDSPEEKSDDPEQGRHNPHL